MNFKSFMEALKGNQHKLDKNKNGKLDAHDFKLLRKEEAELFEAGPHDTAWVEQSARHERLYAYHTRMGNTAEAAKHKAEIDKLYKKEKTELDESEERMARADYKVGTSGRKSHNQIVFKDGESESDEDKAKSQREQFEIDERTMTDAEMKKREEIVKGMKKNVAGFKSKYGDRAKEVMYATANKMAMKEESEEMYNDLEEQAPVAPTLVKHRIGVTVSDPDHPMMSKRTEKMQKFVVVTHSNNKEGAKAVGEKFYKKKGLRVHDSHHAGMVNEEVEDDVNRGNMSRVKQLARQAMKNQMKEDHNLSITDEQADSLIEAANLQEISKATLGSYVKKAAFDSAMKGVKLGGETDPKMHKPTQDALLKRQRGIARATDRLVRKEGVAEGSISDLLNKDPTSPKFNDHSAPRKTKHSGSTPTPYEQGRLDAHRKKSYNNIHNNEQDAEDYKTGYRHVKSKQGVAETLLNKEETENKVGTQHKVGDSVIANSKFFGKQKGVVTKIDKQSIHVKREGKKFSEKYPHDSVMKEEFELEEAMISYSDFLGKIGMHRKAGNAIVDDKYTTNHATYTTVDSDGTARKTTHTPAGSKHQNVGKIKIDDDEDVDGGKPTPAASSPSRGRGRPSGSTGSVYKPRSSETKAAAAAKAAATKAANKNK